jgi:tRNA (cytidine/uridine-2'-O-)-methyltransferase
MRRAGLDYHEFAGIKIYENWREFVEVNNKSRFFGISTKGEKRYDQIAYAKDDFLIFGPETRGLPEDVRNELGPQNLLRIPMLPHSRSLNLSNAAAVMVFEAWRQLGFSAGA